MLKSFLRGEARGILLHCLRQRLHELCSGLKESLQVRQGFLLVQRQLSNPCCVRGNVSQAGAIPVLMRDKA